MKLRAVFDVVRIVWSPQKVYEKVRENSTPNFWIPLFFILFVLTVSTIITIKFIKFEVPEHFKLTQEQIKQLEDFRNSPEGMVLPLIPALFVSSLLLIVVTAVIKMASFAISLKIGFRKLFTVVSFSYLAFSYRQILTDLYVIMTNSSKIYFSPLFFLNISPLSVAGYWISKIELFNIWWIFLLAIGIKVVGEIGFKRSLIFTFMIWFIGNVVSFLWFYFL